MCNAYLDAHGEQLMDYYTALEVIHQGILVIAPAIRLRPFVQDPSNYFVQIAIRTAVRSTTPLALYTGATELLHMLLACTLWRYSIDECTLRRLVVSCMSH